MPVRQINSDFDYVTFSNFKKDFINVAVSIELPFLENETANFFECVVVFFDYDYSNQFSKRTYKLFKYYSETTKELLEKDFVSLGKIQGLYILPNTTEDKATELIEKFNKRHLSI